MRKLMVCLAVLSLMMSIVCVQSTPAIAERDLLEEIINKGYMEIATILAAPPFAFRDKEGNPAGFEVDMLKLLEKKLGVEVKINDYSCAGCIPALLSKRVDLIATRFSTTLARATKVVFVHPWFYTGGYACCRKDAPFQTGWDLNQEGITIGAVEASVGVDAAKISCPKAKIITFPLDIDVIEALRIERIDAAINDELIIDAQVKAYPDELRFLPGNLKPDTYAYMVRADLESIHLREWLDLFFAKIMRSGEYAEMYEKWIGKPWEPTWELHP